MATDRRSLIARAVIALLIAALGFLMYQVFSLRRSAANDGDMETISSDTVHVVITDTVKYYLPIARDSTVVKYVTEMLPVVEPSVPSAPDEKNTHPDSAAVMIPITQKVYQPPDSSYTAYVSGYRPQLDSIFIYPKREIVTINTEVRGKQKRWGVGVQVGYGVTPHGLEPNISVGVSYNFLQF